MTESAKQKISNGLVTIIFVLLTWIAGGVGWLIKQGNDRINALDQVDQDMQKECAKYDNEIKFMAGVMWSDPDVSAYNKDILREIAKLDTRGMTK
jgi:hypothetical protein